jgi:hypothetical protein
LRPGGLLFFTVPFLWPLHDAPHDHYRYTPFALERLLSEAGFDEIELTPRGGWDASLAQMLGLWVRRRPMHRWLRRGLSVLFRPLMQALYAVHGAESFEASPMFVGLTGTAIRRHAPG